jgi:hypothetical protein
MGKLLFHTWENCLDVNYNQIIACVIYALKRKNNTQEKIKIIIIQIFKRKKNTQKIIIQFFKSPSKKKKKKNPSLIKVH